MCGRVGDGKGWAEGGGGVSQKHFYSDGVGVGGPISIFIVGGGGGGSGPQKHFVVVMSRVPKSILS